MEQDGAESQFTQQAVTHSRLLTEDDAIVLGTGGQDDGWTDGLMDGW